MRISQKTRTSVSPGMSPDQEPNALIAAARTREKRKKRGTVLVFKCPRSARIEVGEKHKKTRTVPFFVDLAFPK